MGALTIAAVGDIMLGDHPVRFGNGVRSKTEALGVQYVFSQAQRQFLDCDIAFGNLEVCHSNVGLVEGVLESEEFRGAPSAIPVLRQVGFNVLNVANNHAMEHGSAAFWETAELLKDSGIFAAGIDELDGTCRPFDWQDDELRVQLLSYSLRPENYYRSGRVPYSLRVDDARREERILDEVRAAKCNADVVVVSLHWGEEFLDYPSASQVVFAHNLVDAGAALILGHHPHVLQGIERYKHGVIAYSLGNFVFDMWQSQTRASVILKICWSKLSVEVEPVPVYINSSFQPVPLVGVDRQKSLMDLTALSEKIRKRYLDQTVDSWTIDEIRRSDSKYEKDARWKAQRHRFENYAFFISHLHQYRSSVVRQSLSRFFSRRVEAITAKSQIVE